MRHEKPYVIVQAGGRGSRLRHHTWNKPKCLVSVRGKPILYHIFDKFPGANFIIIGDYAFLQLEKYLKVNPPEVEYETIAASGKGTCAGLAQALDRVPPSSPVIILWSDLILGDLPDWPDTQLPVVCTTSAFTCRWSITPAGEMREAPSSSNGIPGLFYAPKADAFPKPPAAGEFVKWLSTNLKAYVTLECQNMEELGEFTAIEETNDRMGFSRFFNKVELYENTVVKTVVDSNYQEVHRKEVAWYRDAAKLGFRRIPKILSESPLTMQRIHGQHPWQMKDLTGREMRALLADYIDSLTMLHDLGAKSASIDDVEDVYIRKTLQRVRSVSSIIPGFSKKAVTVNGKKCRNPFSSDAGQPLEDLLRDLAPSKFTPIHGDPTFSNSLVDNNLRVWFIDPRGYFSKEGIYGDPAYDFAKVYYSAVGGYDAFNRRKFKLHMDEDAVEIIMEESPYSKTTESIFNYHFGKGTARIKILHGLIWLSLSGYVKDDIDSMIGAFYNGLYWLEDGLVKL